MDSPGVLTPCALRGGKPTPIPFLTPHLETPKDVATIRGESLLLCKILCRSAKPPPRYLSIPRHTETHKELQQI